MCRALRLQHYILLFSLFLVTGCADGPLWKLGYLNPWVVQKWQAEEEFLTSLSNRREQIASIESRLASMDRREADEAVGVLREAILEESIMMVRLDATRILGQVPSPYAADALVGLLSDPEVDIRLAATEALGGRPAIEAVAALRGVIEKEDNIDVRLAAARELANFPQNDDAVDALGLALTDPEPALQFRAMESLAEVTGRDYGHDARKWQAFLRGGSPAESNPSVADSLRNLF